MKVQSYMDSLIVSDIKGGVPEFIISKTLIVAYEQLEPEKIDSSLDFKYNTNARILINKKEDLVFVEIEVEILIELPKSLEFKIGRIKTLTEYKVKDFRKKFLKESQLLIPKEFVSNLISISYSTTRGILTAKAQGSIMQDVVLPIINPIEAIEETMKKKTID